eukprot:COSAG02_NODE_23865_length_705_cov_2.376238_1_plen_54_part_01
MHVVTIGNASTTCRISWIGDSESQIEDFPSHEPSLYASIAPMSVKPEMWNLVQH